jgi:hypothetical protein
MELLPARKAWSLPVLSGLPCVPRLAPLGPSRLADSCLHLLDGDGPSNT